MCIFVVRLTLDSFVKMKFKHTSYFIIQDEGKGI